MRTTKALAALAVCTLLAGGVSGCREEGPAEKAGRAVDEAIDEAIHGDEGALEEAGREIDEAIEQTKEKIRDARED